MATIVQILITAGPSREELFDALRLRDENRRVTFEVQIRAEIGSSAEVTLTALVNGIAAESGSGRDWLLQLHDSGGVLRNRNVSAYYQTTSRTGYIC